MVRYLGKSCKLKETSGVGTALGITSKPDWHILVLLIRSFDRAVSC